MFLPGNKRVDLFHEQHMHIIDCGCVSQGNTGIHDEKNLVAAVSTVHSYQKQVHLMMNLNSDYTNNYSCKACLKKIEK
jgi:hypothetical protein